MVQNGIEGRGSKIRKKVESQFKLKFRSKKCSFEVFILFLIHYDIVPLVPLTTKVLFIHPAYLQMNIIPIVLFS